MTIWTSRIRDFVLFVIGGFVIATWVFGKALLGYDHSFYADAAAGELVWFVILWIGCFPFLVLIVLAFEVIHDFLAGSSETIKLR